MNRDPLEPGGALAGRLFQNFLRRLAETREPEPDDRMGPWRIVSELGRGGSGVVFLAERADGAFTRQVALKWLRGDRPVPGGRAALARERELLAGLDHPNIARLVDGGETDDGMLWFAMDYAAGETIDRHAATLDRAGRLRLVATVCRAVHHAHRRGLIHGDIKPSNVLVDGRGQPRLVDFGIARLSGAAPVGRYGLTPDYASPEQRRGEALTTASDIWQLGRLLADVIGRDDVAADLRAIIDRAMADEPERRYASAEALAADIEAWLDRRPVNAHEGGAGYRAVRAIQRNVALSAVSGAALAIIVGGGAWLVGQLADERDSARTQAARAEAALAETAQALARAEALRDFLVDLFEATRPDRPADALPSTAQILARGAERAQDPGAGPPPERFGMLLTLGGVYLAQSRYEQAAPLIDEALALAREHESIGPVDHARALEHQADLLIRGGGDLERAEALLVEAEDRLPTAGEHWEPLARIRVTRSWVERHRGDHNEALSLVEPVYADMPAAGVDASVRAGLLDSLASLHAATGDRQRAVVLRRRATRAFRDAQGPAGQGHVVSLANGAGLELALGHLDRAVQQARRAIEGYDRIHDKPVDYRASVRNTLARTLLARGEVQPAFATLARAGEEYAAFMDKAPDEWPLYFSKRGSFRARLGRLQGAVADLERARELVREQGGYGARLEATMDMLLAWGLCRDGRAERGRRLLDGIEDPGVLSERPRNAAQLHEARAACHHAAGALRAALDAAKQALAAHDPPGAVLAAADRHMLRARSLAGLDRPAAAARALDAAAASFLDLGLDAHPRLADIRALRATLL